LSPDNLKSMYFQPPLENNPEQMNLKKKV